MMYNFGTCFMRKINELWFEKCILYLEHLLVTTQSKWNQLWVKGWGEGFSCWSQYMSLILELLVNHIFLDYHIWHSSIITKLLCFNVHIWFLIFVYYIMIWLFVQNITISIFKLNIYMYCIKYLAVQ